MSALQKKYINRPENALKKIPFLEGLIQGIDISMVRRALEVGCGPGYISAYLNERYDIQVVGTDVDADEVRFASRNTGAEAGLTFVQADATNLPFGDGEFDMVISQMVLHHIPDWNMALAEIDRVLKPGGYYLFHDLTYSRLLTVLFKPVLRSHGFYSIEEILDYLERLGLQRVHDLGSGTYYCRQFTEYNIALQKKVQR